MESEHSRRVISLMSKNSRKKRSIPIPHLCSTKSRGRPEKSAEKVDL